MSASRGRRIPTARDTRDTANTGLDTRLTYDGESDKAGVNREIAGLEEGSLPRAFRPLSILLMLVSKPGRPPSGLSPAKRLGVRGPYPGPRWEVPEG